MIKVKRTRVKIGDVYAILLPNNKYGFGRIFKDGNIAIYEYIGNSLTDLPTQEKYQFIVVTCIEELQEDGWVKVEHRKFDSVEDAWPPPQCIIDVIDGSYSMYYKCEITKSVYYNGNLIQASKDACKDMEEAAAWGVNHIIDRIMGIDN